MSRTPAEALELQAQDAYETFMKSAYGYNHMVPWAELPEYCREAWRQVILNQAIETELDTKYHLVMIAGRPRIQNKNSGETIPEDEPVMIFRARDRNALAMLRRYDELCLMDSCYLDHMEDIKECIRLFEAFAKDHPDRMKRPGDPNGKIVRSATSESPEITTAVHPGECNCAACQELRK